MDPVSARTNAEDGVMDLKVECKDSVGDFEDNKPELDYYKWPMAMSTAHRSGFPAKTHKIHQLNDLVISPNVFGIFLYLDLSVDFYMLYFFVRLMGGFCFFFSIFSLPSLYSGGINAFHVGIREILFYSRVTCVS